MRSVLTMESLVCGYDTPILGPVDVEIPRGAFVLVRGPNGSGKSTLLKTAVGLLEPLSGRYEWAVGGKARRFVPQVRTLDPVLPATVADVIGTGAIHGETAGGLRAEVEEAEISRVLGEVGMEDDRGVLFRELSEGQKQLVLLGRALVGEPEVMVLDEPTASMDAERERRAVALLEEVRNRRAGGENTELTVVMVAHGSQVAEGAATMALDIDRERNIDFGSLES